MNLVSAWGSTKKRRELAVDVVNFCIKRLMPRMKTLDITIQLSNDLENHSGFCLAVDSREFVIEVNAKESIEEMIETLCHECVHVKQSARGELKDISVTLKRWKGEEWICLYSTLEEYYAFPWEQEAYQLEGVLAKEFIREVL